MEISVTGQALAFAGAAALGILAGIVYDLLRIVRRRADRRAVAGALDLLFWLIVTGALFCYALEAGGGRLRLFMPAGAALGAAFYFLTASAAVCRAGSRMLDAVCGAIRVVCAGVKKFSSFVKNSFLSRGSGIK